MDPLVIREQLRRSPFRPVRVFLSDGSSYDVRHPENAMVTRLDVSIALESDKGDLPERTVICDPEHVTRIEPLDQTRPKKNSKRRT